MLLEKLPAKWHGNRISAAMERHLTEERLLELACDSDREHDASPEENAHLDNCSQCLGKLVELVKKFQQN